jgi:hypothetical protein
METDVQGRDESEFSIIKLLHPHKVICRFHISSEEKQIDLIHNA